MDCPSVYSKTKVVASPGVYSKTEVIDCPGVYSKTEVVGSPSVYSETEVVDYPCVYSKTKVVASPDVYSKTEVVDCPSVYSKTEIVDCPRVWTELVDPAQFHHTFPSKGDLRCLFVVFLLKIFKTRMEETNDQRMMEDKLLEMNDGSQMWLILLVLWLKVQIASGEFQGEVLYSLLFFPWPVRSKQVGYVSFLLWVRTLH